MNKQLIERFYKDECSSDEKRMIFNYFKNHPEELEAYFSEEEWELLDDINELDVETIERMNAGIEEGITPKKSSLQWIKKVAVAASFLLLIGFAWQSFLTDKNDLKQAVAISGSRLVKKINNTDSVLKMVLPDGSLVELFPKSELQYEVPFDSNSRKIYLTGIAKFDVFHDSSRPFSVMSAEIATTALGTSFKVIAEKGQQEVKVQLYEGKVVIRNADIHTNYLNTDYYLKPGEIFFYNRAKRISGISNLEKRKNSQHNKPAKENVNPDINNQQNNWYMFNNQNLAMVFDGLETIYDVRIKYNPGEIKEISFIGKVEQKESIENLLNDIAKLNGLQVIKHKKTFTITKK